MMNHIVTIAFTSEETGESAEIFVNEPTDGSGFYSFMLADYDEAADDLNLPMVVNYIVNAIQRNGNANEINPN